MDIGGQLGIFPTSVDLGFCIPSTQIQDTIFPKWHVLQYDWPRLGTQCEDSYGT